MTAYMCKTDWEYDFPDSNDPGQVFVNIEDLRRLRPCVSECGIVEIEMTLRRVVSDETEGK